MTFFKNLLQIERLQRFTVTYVKLSKKETFRGIKSSSLNLPEAQINAIECPWKKWLRYINKGIFKME